MADLPKRPRLAAHALARGHRLGERLRVVVHDATSEAVVDVGLREWLVLAAADGTRDVEGLTLAANREGARLTAGEVADFLVEIAALGWLEEGIAEAAPTPPAPLEPPSPDQPVVELPGFALHCDGRGACCRFYPTVLFSPHEAAVARAACPTVLDGAVRHEQVFFPHRGSDGRAGLAVVAVDGRCAYLDGDDCCGIHVAAGAAAKPLGCRTFPADLVDDGRAIRVGPVLECACVFASLDRDDGGPLLPGVRRRSDLDAAIHVEGAGPIVVVAEGRVASLEAFRDFSDAVFANEAADPLAAAWALAGVLERAGLDVEAAKAAIATSSSSSFSLPPDPLELLPGVIALGARAAEKVGSSRWRSDDDLAKAGLGLVARAALALVEGRVADCLEGPRALVREAFALRAFTFVLGPARKRAVDLALRGFAIELLVARALAEILAREPHHEALREPIAVVRAVVRAHGVGGYLDDLG